MHDWMLDLATFQGLLSMLYALQICNVIVVIGSNALIEYMVPVFHLLIRKLALLLLLMVVYSNSSFQYHNNIYMYIMHVNAA